MIKLEEKPYQNPKLLLQESKISGKAIFTDEDIEKGKRVILFNGERATRSELRKRIEAGNLNQDDSLQIEEDTFLIPDGKDLSYFINHSCDPDSGVRGENEIIALRDIKKGEEITFDYSAVVGFNVTNWEMKCNCGSEQCRKLIGNWESLPLETLKRYKNAGALQDFILDQIRCKYSDF